MQIERTLVCFVLAAAFSAGFAWAAPPTNIADVPIYAGSVLDKSATQEAEANQADATVPSPLDSQYQKAVAQSVAIYTSTAAPEELFNFYQKQLGAVREPSEGEQSTGAVFYQLDPYDPDSDFVSKAISDYASTDGALMRRSVQTRPRTEEGWIKGTSFTWSVMSSKSDRAQFEVYIDDVGFSFAGDKQQYVQKSLLTVKSISYGTYPSWDVDAHSAGLTDSNVARIEAMYDAPPAEAELGAPVYPGAELDYDLLVRNPALIGPGVFYVTGDPLDKVLAFYEAKTGKKFAKDKQAYVIVLNGTASAPVDILSVQSIGQTLIMFMKGIHH